MASGDPVVQVIQVMPPATLGPQLTVRAGGSTPAERTLCYGFDTTTAEYLDFLCRLHGYDGGGLTFTVVWMAASATTNTVRWRIGIRRIADDAEDLDTSHTYDYNSVDGTAPSASGEVSYDQVTFTDGADMDSWADGEMAIVRLNRDTANDNMSGDAQLLAISGAET
ncbi:MAG TPA: hypothetical protein VFX15_10980 [Actinomycetes bacterium]|nr:hypothetical protein [Actinomycetes bacterium]